MRWVIQQRVGACKRLDSIFAALNNDSFSQVHKDVYLFDHTTF